MQRYRLESWCVLLLVYSLLPRIASPQQEETKPKEKKALITLQVKVANKETGKPIKNADVWVKSVEEGEDFDESGSTNAQGLASLPGVPQGMVLVQVTAKGSHTHSQKYKVSQEQPSISIELEPEHEGEATTMNPS
jgi:Carboxypeptidase regulatory-like domain